MRHGIDGRVFSLPFMAAKLDHIRHGNALLCPPALVQLNPFLPPLSGQHTTHAPVIMHEGAANLRLAIARRAEIPENASVRAQPKQPAGLAFPCADAQIAVRRRRASRGKDSIADGHDLPQAVPAASAVAAQPVLRRGRRRLYHHPCYQRGGSPFAHVTLSPSPWSVRFSVFSRPHRRPKPSPHRPHEQPRSDGG